ncbi:hypothetical protein FHS23_000109 [Prauserella isguenensis]|uniref:Uncharacterized protein n=1 Tax=Prauserella isguenensis TaxID=1470180 RepID=A0A839RVL9_9PSEU|nr:hypothetical protein [Prauserella isguenensis]MBB3049114.1 hypothetical protein [Prauserella isguenensis]
MVESADSELAQRLADNRSRLRAATAEINEWAQQAEREREEAAEARRQAAVQLNKELDEQIAANKEAREDPNSKNEWLQRRDDGGGRTMDFGPAGDGFEDEQAAAAPPQPAATPPQPPAADPAPSQQPTQPGPAARHRRAEEDDDEDFANRDWFV